MLTPQALCFGPRQRTYSSDKRGSGYDFSLRRSLTYHCISARRSHSCPYKWVRFVRAVIRKTSLLQDRTDGPHPLQGNGPTRTHRRREAQEPLANELSGELREIASSPLQHRTCVRAEVASLRSPGTISSSRCQITRNRLLEEQDGCETCFFTDELSVHRSKTFKVWRSSRLVEPDGIEPTTSCLQSRRSPN